MPLCDLPAYTSYSLLCHCSWLLVLRLPVHFTPDEKHKPRRLERNLVLPALLTCPSSAPAAGKQSSCDCAPYLCTCHPHMAVP